ncbi:MAG: UDP-GlcNAc:undecaprenyl-phosphate/decaprenyl-phosphate GlcNAc-phosphate transferase [Clostridia bacterium]|nr:putative undecaprenyl-phosphate n-acetylglucosaminyl 1-phosphatetransferase [Clostridiales bacterium]MDK2985214.1 UDP-GlcNAc:undecaprenyl-phosphate/decaprenyl-phosphate GlcNAc-phosphate transferase [Clostridia bacterium]
MNTEILPASFMACLVAYLITPKVILLAKKIGAIDQPDERKVHQKVMPRLGGLAIYLSFVVAVVAFVTVSRWITGLILGSTLVVMIGIADDTRGLPPKIKLLGQIMAALVAVYFGIRVHFVTNPFVDLIPFDDVIPLGKMVIPFTILWIVGVTNAVNLVDGLDGLAAGISAIASLTMGIVAMLEGQGEVAVLAFLLFASIIGFLKYNFHPAKVFMGDTGSMFLGFILSILAIQGLTKSATVISLFIPVVILGIPIFDTAFAIVRRLIKGNPIFEADKEHLHHRLLELGLSHKQTVVAIYGVSIILSGSAVLLTMLTTEQSILILIGISTLSILAANRIGVLQTRSKIGNPLPKQDFNDFNG